jgi:hypothetical protein
LQTAGHPCRTTKKSQSGNILVRVISDVAVVRRLHAEAHAERFVVLANAVGEISKLEELRGEAG